jgi:hypothetical protein
MGKMISLVGNLGAITINSDYIYMLRMDFNVCDNSYDVVLYYKIDNYAMIHLANGDKDAMTRFYADASDKLVDSKS